MRHKNGALYRAFVGVGNTDEQRNSNNARGAGRRALALLLAFMLCVSFVPMGALASGPPYNLAEEFTLTNGATLVDGEYYAYAGDINFNWNLSGGVDLNKEPEGPALLICFADGANSNPANVTAAIEGIAIEKGMTGGEHKIPEGYYGLGYFWGSGAFTWEDVEEDGVTVTLDNSKRMGYKGISGTITVTAPARYEFYPKTYHAAVDSGWNLTPNTARDSGFYGSSTNNRYGADAEPIVLNVLSSGSVPVTCKDGTLSNVYGLEGSESLLYTSSNSFGFSATAEDGSPVTGAYYTYHDSDGSTFSSGPCVDVGGYYTVTLPDDSNAGTSTPYVEITLLTEPVDDTEVTVNSSVSPDATTAAVSEFSNLYRPGDYVSFTVTPAGENAVADVYATYTYGADGERSLTVQSAGDRYYFYIPEDFGGAADPKVTVHVTTASTAKQETSVKLKLDGGSGADAGGTETYRGGDVLSATATVYDAANNPLTGHAGAVVTFVMPNGEVVNGFLESDGTARATWVVPHDFAESHKSGTVQANFAGDGDYAKSDAASETVNFESTAIKPAAGAAITATAEGTGAETVLTVGQTATLGLSDGAVLVNGTAIDTAGYDVEWFMSDGGAWKPMSAGNEVMVTPWSTSYAYMAAISGKGEYEGEFSLVVSCDTEARSAFDTDSPVAVQVYEGQGFQLSADIYYNDNTGNAATGGVVRFYAAADGAQVYLGEANVVNGAARLSLASASLPADDYTVSAEYSGVSGVYAPAQGKDIGQIMILSATLDSGAFSLNKTELTLGEPNEIALSNGGRYIHGTDYTVSWQVSRDGGLTWESTGNSGESVTVTPENNRWQVRAVVLPAGAYTKPATGFVVGPATAGADAVNAVSVAITAEPDKVFEGESSLLTVVVTDVTNDVPVSGGSVTLSDGTGDVINLPVVNGVAQYTVAGLSQTTTYTAAYSDASGVYDSAAGTVTVRVKSREIEFGADAGKITVNGEMTVGSTVTLTAPSVYASDDTEKNTPLTVGEDFYYQWQYSTDYAAGAGEYTATWLNFSAPDAGDGTGKTVRVTVGSSKTSFRVVAMPYGDYMYPAQGLTSQPVQAAGKIGTEIKSLNVRRAESGTNIFDGDAVEISARLTAKDGSSIDEGYIVFRAHDEAGTGRIIGMEEVVSGAAVMSYTVYEGKTAKISAEYLGTDVYAAAERVETEIEVHSVTISVRTPVSVVGGALTAGTQAEIVLPVVVNAEGTVLTLGEHYYIKWLVDDGSGWNELADPQYADNGNLLYTPANENSKLAAVVYPLSSSNYSEPAEGAAAGVVSGVKRIETTTALAAESSWYEGEGVMLTATVRDAGGEAVLDGQVEFYAQYAPKAGGDVVKNQIGSARLNKNGEAALEYTLPSFEIAGRVQFFAAYMGTEVYQGSSSGWQNGEDTKSATIAFAADAAITIADGTGTILTGEPAVGAQYTLTAPEVYERGNVDAGALACGEEYYYIWEYSEDGGRTWEVVQSDITAGGKTLAGAVFGTDEAEYRATAYPLVGSGTHYRYPATGISVVTNTDPTLIATITGVELGNEYTSSGNIKIYPTGRDVTIKATVTRADSGAPAAGVVKFYHNNGAGDVELGSMNLDPAGQAVLTVPAPAVGDSYTFYAEFQTNEVFDASSSDKTTANAAVLNNTIAMEGTLAIYSGDTAVTGPEVGVEYVVKGASVDVAGESAYNGAVNDEHNSDSTNPYYRYEWQVSQDGGQTWTPVANAGGAADELTVTFDSVNTKYRLAAYPVTESGWTGPSTGVFSNEVGVGQANTEITITLQNADGTALDHGDQGSGVFEGGEIRVVVNVDAVSPDEHLGGTDGTVTLTVFRYDGVNGTEVREDIAISPAESDVDANGNAVFTVTLPAYSYDASAQSNQINFFAEFSGDDYYAPSRVEWQDFVTLKSAAITWGGTYGGFAEGAKKIAIYEGTDTTGTAVTRMEANQDYTLVLPAIYAGDISTASERTGAELENGVHYTVDWQRQLKGSATATGWETVPTGNGGDTLYVASSEVEYSYRAVVSPTEGGGYEFAMDVAFGTLTATNVLTSEPTESTVRTGTVTALEVSDFVAEDNGVEIAAEGEDRDHPFEDLGADGTHMTEYEGGEVTLTATVTEAGDVSERRVYEGNVYFYRYVDGTNDVRLNDVGVEVDSNGVATLTVNTSEWDDTGTALSNVDRYYAVYEGTSVFETSESKGADAEGNVTGLQDVYVRSTAIETPRIKTSVNGDNSANTTTNSGDLTGLPAAVEINFALIQSDGSAASGYSVTAADGRWLTEGEDYSIQWYREEATVAEGGGETYVDRAIDGATFVNYTKDANSVYQKFSVQLAPAGHMLTGAKSYHAVIGSRAEPVVSLDPGYTFTPTADGTAVVSGVQVIDGAHYGDEVTLTATVSGAEGTNALPTGTVQFWYRTPAEWVRLGEPVTLTQKDAHENELVAEAELVVDTAELPFNIDRVGFSYSGDEFYEAYTPEVMYNESGDTPMAKRSFKLWSVQISNPAHEPESEIGGVPGEGYTPDYSDPKHYPDGVSYGNVTIRVYEYDADAENYKGVEYENDELIANSRYVLEVGDIYTKSGEKLEFMHDNSGDITVEWFKSEDGGEPWSPLPLTEYTNIDGRTIAVTPETRDHKYMVKVTTANSFYNELRPSLVDFEYSEDNIDTVLQEVTVAVEAEAGTPVNGVAEWVYQLNPITLSATVTPVSEGEPSGHVEFYYGWALNGSAEGDYSGYTAGAGEVPGVSEWLPVVSDGDEPTNVAELVKVSPGTDKDGVMQASITTSSLPVGGDGTYGQLVIKAVYTGDQTYAENDNINGSVNISSDVVTVFSSVALQDKENIENQVLDSISVDGNGNVTAWSKGSANGDGHDGIIISSKDLVSDGTNTTLTLHPIYTLDAIDRETAIPGYDGAEKLGELEDIYRLKLNVDYTVEWQYCSTYEAYEEFLSGSDEGMNWAAMDTSTSSDTCAIKQVYSYAFRAKITFLDTPKARAAYAEFDNYGAEAVDGERVLYSNILTVGDAEGRLFANIRKASSASANGDTVYIDALMMGGSTTPVGSLSVKVVDRFDNLVFEDTRNNVNGGTTFTWSGAEPGEYTITTSFSGNNGFKAEENVQQYIVRFTSADQTGEAGVPGVLSMGIHASPATYNGQAQMLSGGDVTISGFGDYTEWAALAGEAVTFQYFDGEGNRVAEPTEAGTYSVKAYLPETMYWGYVEAWGTYTISQRGVSIADVTAQAKTYDGVAGVNIQAIELEQSATDGETGLPSGSTGIVEGDSVYVTATGRLNAAAGGNQTLSLMNAALAGPDAGNYVIANTDYTESFTVSRSQLYGDAYDVITAAPGYRIGDDDFYMIDQSGNQIGAARAQITYYYHSGNEIEAVDTTTAAGKYTVVIGMNETNYKGGLTLTLWIDPNAAQAVKEGSVERTAASALIDITDTNYVYDGQAHGVTAVATTGEAVTVEYAGADGNYSAVQPIDAGRYMVRAYTGTGANGELLNVAYGIMTIVKGEPQATLTATGAVYSGHRYDGAPALAVETFNAGHDKLDHIYGETYYTFVGGSITGYSYNAPRDVSYVADGAYDDSVTSGAYGTYVVTAHVPETANTVALTASAEYQITKAPLTIYGEDTYIELFDTQSKFTATYDGFVDGDYGADSELRDLIAMPTFRLGENSELSNDELSHVGYLTIHMSDVNARNYAVSYVDGEAAINNQAPWPALEIRGVPGTIYYGDEFQAFLYGSSGQLDGGGAVITNEASKVTWKSSDPAIAEVDAQGNITVKGVGEFTITGTRGDDPNTAISKSETYTALSRRNDVVIAREDVPYNAGKQSIAEVNYSFYYMMHGTLFESQDPLSADHCTITGQPQSESGEYPVSASITGASKNVGDGRGLLAIHRVNSTVTPIAQTSVYGDVFTFPGRGEDRYTAAPIVAGDSLADVLASGVVQADARYNSDVDGYEILVAGGTEGYNYNVSYAHYDAGMADNDYDITQRELTFTVGSLTDTEGATNQWREKNDNELAGLYTNLPEAAFENEGDRVFGERNQVLDYQIGGNGLIGGDSVADLWDTGRAQAEFAVLNVDYDLSAEAAANEEYNDGDKITSEHGTLDHQLIVPDPTIDEADYVITGQTKSRNYSVTVVNGRLDVTQRPVSIANTTVVVPAGTSQSDLMTIIGPQLKIEGLAENLEHDYRDLLLSVSGLNTSAGAGEQTVRLISANTNYYLDPNESTITVVIGNITANGEFIVKTHTRTVLQLQRTIAPEGASAYVEPAGGIADLRLTVTASDPDSGTVLVPATAMTELHEGDAGWDSSWDSSRYAYYELNHATLKGYLVRYGLEATGYIFYVQD